MSTRSDKSARHVAKKQRLVEKELVDAADEHRARIAAAASRSGVDGAAVDVLELAKLLMQRGLVDHRSAEAVGAAMANDTDDYTLDLQDMLTSRNIVGGEVEKKEKQGRFELVGWTTVGVESQLMIELERAFAPVDAGAVEVDVTGFDPIRQFAKSSDKHHILCLYSSSDGSHGGWEDNAKAWVCWRVGNEYVSDSAGTAGLKAQAAARGVASLNEARYEARRWSGGATYTLRIEFDAHAATLFVDGKPVVPLKGERASVDFSKRRESLRFVFVGMDNQTPGFDGVRFSNLRVWRRRLSAKQLAELAAEARAHGGPLQNVPAVESPRGVALHNLDDLPRKELLRRLDQMVPVDPSAYGRVHYMVKTGLVPGKFNTKYPIQRPHVVDATLHSVHRQLAQLDALLGDVLTLARLTTPLGDAARAWKAQYDALGQLSADDNATLPSPTTTTTTTTTSAPPSTTTAMKTEDPAAKREAEERKAALLAQQKHNKMVRKFRQKEAAEQVGGSVWHFDGKGRVESVKETIASVRLDEHGLKPVENVWYSNGTGKVAAARPFFNGRLPLRTALPAVAPSTVRIVGWNLADLKAKNGGGGDERLRRAVDWLKRAQADVVVLWGLGDKGVGVAHLLPDGAGERAKGSAWSPQAVRAAGDLWGHRHAKRLDTQSGVHMAVTSRFPVEALLKAGKALAYGGASGDRFALPVTKFFNGAHVVRINVTAERPLYVLPTSLDPNSGIARRFEAQAVIDALFEGVPEPESAPVVLLGGLEAMSRHDEARYREQGTTAALRDALLPEKQAALNTDLGLLFDAMDLLGGAFADVCARASGEQIDASLPTAVADAIVPVRFGAMRLDYVLVNRRAQELHEQLRKAARRGAAPLCGAVRDEETHTLSSRFPLAFEMALD